MKPNQNHSHRLWWTYGDRSDVWYNEVVTLPDIRYRYYLQFESSKSYAANANVAIDDFSLSPECFGIGLYYNNNIKINFPIFNLNIE